MRLYKNPHSVIYDVRSFLSELTEAKNLIGGLSLSHADAPCVMHAGAYQRGRLAINSGVNIYRNRSAHSLRL